MKTLEFDRRVPAAFPVGLGFRAGVAKVDLTPALGTFTAGWGPNLTPRKAMRFVSRLFGRALVLDDGEGERVALLAVNLHAGSRYVAERVGVLTADAGLHVGRIVLAGAHTHSGPGNLYASPYYDAFCTSFPWVRGFHQEWADDVAARLAAAVHEAVRRLEPARVGWAMTPLWDWSANRSLAAALRNVGEGVSAADVRRALPWAAAAPASVTSLERLFVDPRLQVLAATTAAGAPLGAFATFGAHNALLAREHDALSADWFGVAEETAERTLQNLTGVRPVVGLAAGAIGDADPRPPGVSLPELIFQRQRSLPDNLELVKAHGTRLGALLAQTFEQAMGAPALRKLTVRSVDAHVQGVTVQTPEGPRTMPTEPRIGASTLAGSELGRGVLVEGLRDGNPAHADDPHFPKEDDDLGMRLIQPVLDVLQFQSDTLPLRVVQLDGVVVAGLPGEPTTWLSFGVTRLLQQQLGAREVMVAGVCGDYVGYLTSPREYEAQHYEGASTLWGRHTEAWLHQALGRLCSAPPATPSGAVRFFVEPFTGPRARSLSEHRARFPSPQLPRDVPKLRVQGDALRFAGALHWSPERATAVADWGTWLRLLVDDGTELAVEPHVTLDEFGGALWWTLELREWSLLEGRTVTLVLSHPDGEGHFTFPVPRR